MQQAGSVEVRTYRARSQADAAQLFGTDAQPAAARGMYPAMQMWTPPQTWRLFVTPIVLVVAGLVLAGVYGMAAGAAVGVIYMVVVMLFRRPKGTLTVTFSAAPPPSPVPGWQGQAQAWPSPAQPTAAPQSYSAQYRNTQWDTRQGR